MVTNTVKECFLYLIRHRNSPLSRYYLKLKGKMFFIEGEEGVE